MKEYAVLRYGQEYATTERESLKMDIMYAKFLLYQKCINEINNNPEFVTIKNRLNNEQDLDKKGSIIYDFIMSNHLRQFVNIDNYFNVKDILYFNSISDYLKQFKD